MGMLARIATLGGGVAASAYVDDVFGIYTRTGTGASATITNGIDLSTKGGLVITKARSTTTGWRWTDTARGVQTSLDCSSTAANATESTGLTAFGTTGYTIGAGSDYNNSSGPTTYADFAFRQADKFFGAATVTKSAGSNATASFANLGTLGMVVVKRTDSTSSWYVWHRSLTAGKLVYLEQTAAEATLGHITVSGTTVTLVNGTIADGSYVVYAWAHDTAADGLIQCGGFTTDGSGNATVTLGWEPQFVIEKVSSATGDWVTVDSMRGNPTASGASSVQAWLRPHLANAELMSYGAPTPTATGFAAAYRAASTTYIYLAIRRSNKPPTLGTQVYSAISRSGTSADVSVTGVGFPPDLVVTKRRVGNTPHALFDRLRGPLKVIRASQTAAEASSSNSLKSFNSDGVAFGSDNGYSYANWSYGGAYINLFFRRATGVHDQICFSGTGASKTESHTVLGVAPELWLVKGRSGSTEWVWGSSLLANTEKIVMPSPAGVATDATAWNSTYPTATALSLGTAAAVNTDAATYTAYLWATLTGVSKVGSYTGNGSNQTIDCGFTTGARFVMIIRTTASTPQGIFIWDTVRGIVAGNDPHLSLNTGEAEVTDDSIDPDTGGFIVNELATTHINVNGAVYIFLAYA